MNIIIARVRGLSRLLLHASAGRPALLNAFTAGLDDQNRQEHTLNMAWQHRLCHRYFLIKKSSRGEARAAGGWEGGRWGEGGVEVQLKAGGTGREAGQMRY